MNNSSLSRHGMFLLFVLLFGTQTCLAGFEKALGPRAFSFPADHGSHDQYQVEWWYLTYNAHTDLKEPISGQFTLFRFGLKPSPTLPESWTMHHVYMGHATLIRPARQEFIFNELYARDSFGLAGVTNPPFRSWIKHWHLQSTSESFFPMHLKYTVDDYAIDLILDDPKPIVLHGQGGYSQKGQTPGNASYYYTIPRYQLKGTLSSGQEALTLEGQGWLDREWSTSVLDESQVGWSWFALQFDDGTELMIYRMLRADGTMDPNNYVTFINQQGMSNPLDFSKITINAISQWTSPIGVDYGTRWQISIPERSLDIEVIARMDHQWNNGRIPYWEGSVDIRGTHKGQGFVEQFISTTANNPLQ